MASSSRNRSLTGVVLCSISVFLALCFTAHNGAWAAAAEKTKGTAGEKKRLERLESLEAQGPIVTLVDGNFSRYAEGKTRAYHTVLLFTALGPTYNCHACRMVDESFVEAATAYARQDDIRTSDNPVVFARLDISTGGSTFRRFSKKSAPHVYLIPIGQNLPVGPELDSMEVTKGLSRPDGKIDGFVDDLNRVTGTKMVIVPDTSGLLEVALLLGVVLGVIGHFLAGVPTRMLAVIRNKGLWFALSIACYMTGVGGIIFCIIRNPRTHGIHQQSREAIMFSPGGRDQFWYEGLVVGLFYLGISAAIGGAYAAAGWKRVPSMLRGATVLACTTLLCYLSVEYFKLYTRKTAWYSLAQMLPPQVAELHKGPLKRKHGLLKRVVRLSHVWLNEYTTLEEFGTKLKALLWNYLARRVKGNLGL